MGEVTLDEALATVRGNQWRVLLSHALCVAHCITCCYIVEQILNAHPCAQNKQKPETACLSQSVASVFYVLHSSCHFDSLSPPSALLVAILILIYFQHQQCVSEHSRASRQPSVRFRPYRSTALLCASDIEAIVLVGVPRLRLVAFRL